MKKKGFQQGAVVFLSSALLVSGMSMFGSSALANPAGAAHANFANVNILNPFLANSLQNVDSASSEAPGTLTAAEVESTQTSPYAAYNLTGFAVGNTGGGVITENDARYKKVYNAVDLAQALKKGSGIKVIEIMNDLDLGWNELPSEAKTAPFAAHNNAPLTHPVLLKSGISKLTIDGFDGLTIFSANGSTIKHVGITVKRSSNLIIRNLEFDELWEWDENTKGDYDRNDWDYLTLEESNKVWIDHCTFHKAYDGVIDSKKGTSGLTISWSDFRHDDGSANSWVSQQIKALEANKSAYPMYNYLRSSAVGMTQEDIIAIAGGQKKMHLVGANEFAADNADLELTLHHNYYEDVQDRMPRMRAGNAHAYNIVMDAAGLARAKARITEDMAKAITSKGYKFTVTSNGAISTENAAVLVEKSHIIDVNSPIRNNQKAADNARYTGKILALDTMYTDTAAGIDFRGDSTTADSPLAPYPAPALAFSWNGFSKLPYSYTADDPSTLVNRLQAADGAGAGKISWQKNNWLLTQY